MKRIDINTHQVHFIGCWNLENKKLCNQITDFFKDNKNLQKQGITASGKDLKKKSRIDITISPNDLKKPKFNIFEQYVKELHKCFIDYKICYICGIKKLHVFNFTIFCNSFS